MKRLNLSLLIISLFTFYSSCDDQTFQPDDLVLIKAMTPIFGENGEYILEPQKFNRDRKNPTVFQVPLVVDNFQCFTEPYYLNVVNGDGNGVDAVTSAIISIDGKVIFRQSDFKKKVNDMISNVSITENSVLTIELRGKPGTFIILSIEGNNSQCRWEYLYSETEINHYVAPPFISTIDGGFIFLNNFENVSSLVKLSSQGLVEWEKKIDTTPYGYLNSVAQANDGGYIVTGSSTIKTDEYGDIQWQNPSIQGECAIQTMDDGYLILSHLKATKLSSAFDLDWIREIKIDNAGCVIEVLSNDGGYVIGGRSLDLDEFVAEKINKDGETVWYNSYGGVDYLSGFTSIVHDGNGGFMLAGTYNVVCNIDSDGSAKFFAKRLTLPESWGGTWNPGFIITSCNGFIIGTTGFKNIPPPDYGYSWNCYIVEIDHQGIQLRNKLIERESSHITGGIAQSSDGYIIIGGSKFGDQTNNLWAIKVGFDN